MNSVVDELNLDVTAEKSRALHRVVRAMHDGHCPSCGHLANAETFSRYDNRHECPECHFQISKKESEEALKTFQPSLSLSVKVFEEWRQLLKNKLERENAESSF